MTRQEDDHRILRAPSNASAQFLEALGYGLPANILVDQNDGLIRWRGVPFELLLLQEPGDRLSILVGELQGLGLVLADSQGEDVGPAGSRPIVDQVELVRSTIDAAGPSRQSIDSVWATHEYHARFQGPSLALQVPLHCHAVLIQPEIGEPFLTHADSQIDSSLLRA